MFDSHKSVPIIRRETVGAAINLNQVAQESDRTCVVGRVKCVRDKLIQTVMTKKLFLGITLAAAARLSTRLLADAAEQHHGIKAQGAACAGTQTSAAAAAGGRHGHHAMHPVGMYGGHHGGMQARHADGGGRHGMGAHGAQRGQEGESCPLYSERKPT